ncbi:glycosyltransferase family 4 protein [Aquimarina sp. RZ0]|uniref:glycosyltransferase family 4 protein n=1 Tax=Aquimarina sp. RZ0 TaxID=2607730 RepID=UPI0011F15BDE|nr:glycosyltransferase family 4 protein [Aquimarina sp. RZ0]KAA1244139.1 glycosyltransferase family 4 protein [Aquimarina sp. RZ0]
MNKEIAHIVFLTPGFAVNEDDSTTIPALQVYLKSLKKTLPQTSITIITFQFPFIKDSYKWYGINVIPLNGRNQHLKKPWVWQKALLTLKKIHLQNPIDAIHSLWIGECSFIGNKFALKYNIPHIVTVMGQDALKNRYIRFLINKKTKIITLSINHQKTLYKTHKINSAVIPWSIDTSSFPVSMENEIDILGVGSLNKVKNFKEFIEIVSLLVKDFPELKTEIIGDGDQYQKLSRIIVEKGLQKNILLCKSLPRTDVLFKMSKSNFFLHTSSYESFGYVFVEALYSGMTIVSFDVGIATQIKAWKISNNREQMISNCIQLLSGVETKKERILLSPEQKTVTSYIKLYTCVN